MWPWRSGGGKSFWRAEEGTAIYHLEREGLEGRGCRVKSPSLSLSTVLSLSTSQQLTTQQSPLQAHHDCFASQAAPSSRWPPETFVPFISTTNTYRCSGKEGTQRERISKYMPPHPLNDCWFGGNLLLYKQTACWGAHARSGLII